MVGSGWSFGHGSRFQMPKPTHGPSEAVGPGRHYPAARPGETGERHAIRARRARSWSRERGTLAGRDGAPAGAQYIIQGQRGTLTGEPSDAVTVQFGVGEGAGATAGGLSLAA